MQRERRPPEVIVEALTALGAGEPRVAVSRRLGVPYHTLGSWQRRPPAAAQRLLDGLPVCERCLGDHDVARLDAEAYAYLLGVYLGDGCISQMPGTSALRITMDVAYPEIIGEVAAAIHNVRGREPSKSRSRRYAMVTITSYWKSWQCLFPQHGPGKKHTRRIVLEPWQCEIAEREPGRLLRGLIHTDGWRGENRVTVKGHDYSYPRYQFSNRSDDIRDIFCVGCELLGIEWRPWGRWHISVARRDAVAALDLHVGLKT